MTRLLLRMGKFLNHKFWGIIRQAITTFDYFEIRAIFAAWYFFAYMLVPVIIPLGVRSAYVRYVVGQELYLYTLPVFLIIMLGIASFLIGYQVIISVLKKNNKELREGSGNILMSKIIVLFCFGTGLVGKIVKIFGGTFFHLNKNPLVTTSVYSGLIGVADSVAILGLGVACGIYFSLRRNGLKYQTWQLIAYALFCFEFLLGFLSLGKFEVFTSLFIFLFIRHYLYKPNIRIVFAWVFALFLVFFPIQSYIGTPSNIDSYKSYWASRNVQNTTSNTAVSDITTPSTIIPIMDFISDGVFGRFDLSRTLGKIVLITNETGKFWNGKSLKNFFISLGPPRILWHSKPAVNTGHNEFGREFGIIAPNNYTTAVAPGLLGDWYLNFGLWGIAMGLMIHGVFLGFLVGFLYRHRWSVYWVAACGTLVPNILIAGEGWVGASMAGVIKLIIVFCVLFFASRTGVQWVMNRRLTNRSIHL